MDQSVLLAQMRDEEVHLRVQDEDGWIVTFDRTPLKVQLASLIYFTSWSYTQSRSKEEN